MILTGLALGAVLGFVLQRGRFCVTGAFRDVFVTKNTKWLTAFLIVIAVHSVGFFALSSLGLISASTSEDGGAPTLACRDPTKMASCAAWTWRASTSGESW